jgi:hypothetical protein
MHIYSRAKNKKVLILCSTDPRWDQRPNLMINWLKDKYDVTVLGLGHGEIEGVRFIEIKKAGGGKAIFLKKALFLFLHHYERVSWPIELQGAFENLRNDDFDLIISQDLIVLPLAFAIHKKAKILLDAREFYPRQFEDLLIWNLLFSPYFSFLCEKYLHQVDKIITPSPGFVTAYKDAYGVNSEVIMSWPAYLPLEPQKTSSEKIRIIHHGIINRSRKIENMIFVMDELDKRFLLDLILVGNENSRYFRKIKSMISQRRNVRLLPPLPFTQYIPFTNSYDIGLHMLAPTNYNHRITLPNKLFEFIQARLSVAIGPTEELVKIIRQYDCGVVSKDFSPSSMAATLSELDAEKIQYYKNKSNQAARLLCAENNRERVDSIVSNLLN